MESRVKFKIGEIEFEAEGSPEIVERERDASFNILLPAAVDALVRTRETEKMKYIEVAEQPPTLLLTENSVASQKDNATTYLSSDNDLSRTSLASFMSKFGKVSEQDFTLMAVHYDEKKNDSTCVFSLENIKKYYAEARRPEPSNISLILNQLTKKGFIMDAPNAEQKFPKHYILTSDGMKHIETYEPKQEAEKSRIPKSRKTKNKPPSAYCCLNLDDLNTKNYPVVKSLKDFKEKMMMVLYIVTNEKKGEWFTAADVLCLMTDIFGEAATIDQVNGVFKREKIWFKEDKSDGIYKRKLLNGGLDFAKKIMSNTR